MIVRRALVQLLNLDGVSLAEVDLLSDVVGVGELRHDRQVSRRLGKRQLGVVHDRVVVVLLSVAGGPPGKGQLAILGLYIYPDTYSVPIKLVSGQASLLGMHFNSTKVILYLHFYLRA